MSVSWRVMALPGDLAITVVPATLENTLVPLLLVSLARVEEKDQLQMTFLGWLTCRVERKSDPEFPSMQETGAT